MRKRSVSNCETARLFGPEELAAYLNLGVAAARGIAEKAGAVVRIGRSVRFDRVKVDAFLDKLSREG